MLCWIVTFSGILFIRFAESSGERARGEGIDLLLSWERNLKVGDQGAPVTFGGIKHYCSFHLESR